MVTEDSVIKSISGSDNATVFTYSFGADTEPTPNLNGTAENQNGEPCVNCTVRIMGVDKTKLDVNPTRYQEKADELLAEAENVTPPAWDPDRQLTGQDGYARANDTEYIAVHTRSDWNLRGNPYANGTKVSNAEVNLGQPHIQVDPDETITLSVWDPEREAAFEDTVDSELFGRTVPESRTLVVQELGPGGDIISNTTRQTQPTIEITNVVSNQGTKTHYTATLNVDTGFYRVYPPDHPERSIVVLKGNEETLVQSWETDLENEHDRLSAKAERFQELIQEQNKLKTWTTTTDENGSWSQSIPSDYITVTPRALRTHARSLALRGAVGLPAANGRTPARPARGDLQTAEPPAGSEPATE